MLASENDEERKVFLCHNNFLAHVSIGDKTGFKKPGKEYSGIIRTE